jgi:hypothetical protein
VSRGIFLIHNNGQLVELREQAYDSEALLQELLANYPSLLAGDQIDPSQPRRWLLIAREAGVPGEQGGGARWAVDHLFLDQDAVPTLVEVKRSSDTRIRREVVGQMLDYAANAVVYWPVDHLYAQFEIQCRARNLDPDQELAAFLGPTVDPTTFWQRAKTHLQAGRVRLVFVADVIPPELRRIIEFLNQQMDPAEVLGVEIRHYTGEGLRTLVPSVVGQTSEAQQRKTGPGSDRPQWDEPSFFEHLANQRPPEEVAVAHSILEWASQRVTHIWWGKGQRAGSFVPTLEHQGTDHQLFAVWSSGSVEIYFYWYAYKPLFAREARRLEILEKLNAIPGIALPESAIRRRPNIPLADLVGDNRLNQFLAVFEWYLEQVKTS